LRAFVFPRVRHENTKGSELKAFVVLRGFVVLRCFEPSWFPCQARKHEVFRKTTRETGSISWTPQTGAECAEECTWLSLVVLVIRPSLKPRPCGWFGRLPTPYPKSPEISA